MAAAAASTPETNHSQVDHRHELRLAQDWDALLLGFPELAAGPCSVVYDGQVRFAHDEVIGARAKRVLRVAADIT